jgi:GntR family transcriptional regulator
VGLVDRQLIEDTLMRSMWTSRPAVRAALQMLADGGLVSRRPRFGTTVIGQVALVPMQELMPLPTAQPGAGCVRVEQLETREVPVSAILAERLATERDSVFLTEQLTFIDDEPVSLRAAYLVTDLSPLDAKKRLIVVDSRHVPSATAFAQFFGVPVGKVEATVEAIPGDPETCQILGMLPGSPVLFRESVHFDTSRTPRMLVHTHYRGDRVAISTSTEVDSSEDEPSQAIGR